MTQKIQNSSVLTEASFSEGKLTLRFTNGRSATYLNVDKSVYDQLVGADSPGRYFNANIRNKFTLA